MRNPKRKSQHKKKQAAASAAAKKSGGSKKPRRGGPKGPRKPPPDQRTTQPMDRDTPLRPLGPLLPVEPRAEDPKSRAAALAAVDAALEKKCLEPVLLDVRALASYTDYILVCSGRSDRQVGAVADGVTDALKLLGKRPIGSEGRRDGQWSLVDFGDIIVHVFYHPVREFYDLEGLWSDAPRIKLDIPPEARAQYQDSYVS